MGMSEKIKIVLLKKDKNAVDLAKKLNCTPVNIYNKFKRDNFSEKELQQIAEALDCDLVPAAFIIRDTGEKV